MPRLLPTAVGRAQAIDVGAGVDRVDQQAVERRPVGPPPFEFALVVAARGAHRHPDAVVGEVAQDLADGAEPVVQVEDQADRRLRLLVGIQDDLPGGPAHIAHGDGPAQLAAPRLGHPRFEHSGFENVQFGFRHGRLQAQQEPVIVTAAGIIHRFGIGDERVEQGADLEQLVPVPARPRQARHLDAEDEADVAEADLGDQPLEPEPTLDGLSGAPEVVIDHDDALARPSEVHGALDQSVLEAGGFLVTLDLLRRGLPDVDDGQTFAVTAADLVRQQDQAYRCAVLAHHRDSPR